MKERVWILLLCLAVFLAVVLSSASAETLGYGTVNAAEIVLRKTPGGQKLIRLPKDTCVWIKDAAADSRGDLWYEVNLGYYDEGTYRGRSGWMKAEFIDAGEQLWHGVTSVRAGQYGIMALRKDGTVECVCDMDNQALRAWSSGLRDVRQVSLLTWLGWGFYALDGSGTFSDPDGNSEKGIRLSCDYGYPYLITEDNRLLTGGVTGFTWIWPREAGPEQLSRVTAMTDNAYRLLLLTDDGRVFAACSADDSVDKPEPDWEHWTDVVSLDAGIATFTGGRPYHYVFTAVRKDGTVLAAPAELAEMLSPWQDMRKVAVGYQWILGLKRDGTVLVLSPGGAETPDVSAWTGIRDIGNGGDYLVGVREDGTLLFAGTHDFGE